jgi:hypothetical protein
MSASPTSLDRHAKRHLVDNFEWRNRLEQLAEMRRTPRTRQPVPKMAREALANSPAR